jgi:hypothetical protein
MQQIEVLKTFLATQEAEEIPSGTLYRKRPPQLENDVLVL